LNMKSEKIVAGFIGAGGIARSHAFCINSLRFYYNDSPQYHLEAVSSASEKSRTEFALRFGFTRAVSIEDFTEDKEINTVFILGPNKVHFQHLRAAIAMKSVKRIYLEKPVCSTLDEEKSIAELASANPDIRIQVGFQFLFVPAVSDAISFLKTGALGKPIHFDFKYYHGDYLKKEYRDKRGNRLTPAPDGGAMADLGSHVISLAVATLGNKLLINSALQAGKFADVSPDSDLFSQISLFDEKTKACGTLSASRISSGTGDMFNFEIYGEKGALKYSSHTPDYFEYYLEETGLWNRKVSGSSYPGITGFPSVHVPPGWLRSMIHAHYVFLTDNNQKAVIPDIKHGLEVQRLVRQTAVKLAEFRKNCS
jgi:predicted dehydrogenase